MSSLGGLVTGSGGLVEKIREVDQAIKDVKGGKATSRMDIRDSVMTRLEYADRHRERPLALRSRQRRGAHEDPRPSL